MFIYILTFLFVIYSGNTYSSDQDFASQFVKRTFFIPESGGKSDYRGYNLAKSQEDNGIKKIKLNIKSQVSLGGEYVQEVRNAIRDSNQFVVFFMYRFDHPALIHELGEKYITFRQNKNKDKKCCIPLVFLDHNDFFSDKDNSRYRDYVRRLSREVPLSYVKLQRETDQKDDKKRFHHKIIICKKENAEATVFIGSANATYEADNQHSEDTLIIKSNNLAHILLREFNKFFNSNIAYIYDDLVVSEEKKNQTYLDEFINLTPLSQKENILAEPKFNEGFIESLVISDGFYSTKKDMAEKNNQCLDLVEKILNKKNNKALIYFQNHFNLLPTEKNEKRSVDHFKKFRINLSNQSSKLIVRWGGGISKKHETDDKEEYLYKDNIKYMIYNPYTHGKFHHKAIIQYLDDKEPILYTGSFNFSSTAVEDKSENIIGIRSASLVENYLCSVLWNSDLAAEPEIWTYIKNNNSVFGTDFDKDQSNTKMREFANKVLLRTEDNIEKYRMRLKSGLERLQRHISDGLKLAKKDEYSDLEDLEKGYNKHFGKLEKTFERLNKLQPAIEALDIFNNINLSLTILVPENMSFYIRDYVSALWNNLIMEKEDYSKMFLNIKETKSQLKQIKSLLPTLPEDTQPKNDKIWIDRINDIIQGIVIIEGKEVKKDEKKYRRNILIYQKNIKDIHDDIKDLSLLAPGFIHLNNLHEKLRLALNIKNVKNSDFEKNVTNAQGKVSEGNPLQPFNTDPAPQPKKPKRSYKNESNSSNSKPLKSNSTNNDPKNQKESNNSKAGAKNDEKSSKKGSLTKNFEGSKVGDVGTILDKKEETNKYPLKTTSNKPNDQKGRFSSSPPAGAGKSQPSNNHFPEKKYRSDVKSQTSNQNQKKIDSKKEEDDDGESSNNKPKKGMKKPSDNTNKKRGINTVEYSESDKDESIVVKIPTKDKKQSSKEASNQDSDAESEEESKPKKPEAKKPEAKKTKKDIDDFDSRIGRLYKNNLGQDISSYYDDLDKEYKTSLSKNMARLKLTKEDLKSEKTMKKKWKDYEENEKYRVQKLLEGLKSQLNDPDPNYRFGF